MKRSAAFAMMEGDDSVMAAVDVNRGDAVEAITAAAIVISTSALNDSAAADAVAVLLNVTLAFAVICALDAAAIDKVDRTGAAVEINLSDAVDAEATLPRVLDTDAMNRSDAVRANAGKANVIAAVEINRSDATTEVASLFRVISTEAENSSDAVAAI
jgi:hypothetical protein